MIKADDGRRRVAILGASHWHVPLYLPALAASDAKVVAVCDPDPAACRAVASRFDAACHANVETLLEAGPIDFAFVFGIHADMPRLASALIRRRIAFALEKPCGMTGAAVAAIAREAAGLFVAVPLIFRLSAVMETLNAVEADGPARTDHIGFRFMAGPASRYPAMGCAWMLDPAQSGGGCAINLAPHFIDLFHILSGQSVRRVSAVMRAGTPGCTVEDHAALILTGSGGTTGTIETSYSYPSTPTDLRELSFSLSTARAYVHSTPDGVRVVMRAAPDRVVEKIALTLGPDALYGDFVVRTLSDVAARRVPVAGLPEMVRVMRVIDAAYASARSGGWAIDVEE